MHAEYSSTLSEKTRIHENLETSIHDKSKKDKRVILPWERHKKISIETCNLKRELEYKLFCLSGTNWLTEEVVENAIRCVMPTTTRNETFLL